MSNVNHTTIPSYLLNRSTQLHVGFNAGTSLSDAIANENKKVELQKAETRRLNEEKQNQAKETALEARQAEEKRVKEEKAAELAAKENLEKQNRPAEFDALVEKGFDALDRKDQLVLLTLSDHASCFVAFKSFDDLSNLKDAYVNNLDDVLHKNEDDLIKFYMNRSGLLSAADLSDDAIQKLKTVPVKDLITLRTAKELQQIKAANESSYEELQYLEISYKLNTLAHYRHFVFNGYFHVRNKEIFVRFETYKQMTEHLMPYFKNPNISIENKHKLHYLYRTLCYLKNDIHDRLKMLEEKKFVTKLIGSFLALCEKHDDFNAEEYATILKKYLDRKMSLGVSSSMYSYYHIRNDSIIHFMLAVMKQKDPQTAKFIFNEIIDQDAKYVSYQSTFSQLDSAKAELDEYWSKRYTHNLPREYDIDLTI